MAFGLSATDANATNRIGVLLQSVVATFVFARHDKVDWRGSLKVMIPVEVGALIGVQLSIEVPERALRATIGVVIVLVLVSMDQPKRWLVDVERVRIRGMGMVCVVWSRAVRWVPPGGRGYFVFDGARVGNRSGFGVF